VTREARPPQRTAGATLAGSGSGRRAAFALAGVALFCLSAACSDGPLGRGAGDASPQRPQAEADLLHRILIAEDGRASTGGAIATLLDGVASSSAEVRRIAVRALGRLERDSLVARIVPLLEDPDPAVRAEAANAVAQAVLRSDPAVSAPARSTLLGRLGGETDPVARSALAQSAGRTRHGAATDVATTANAIASAAGQSPDPATDLGAAKGLYLLARQQAGRGAFPDAAAAYLGALLRAPPTSGADAATAQRTRTLAVAALAAAGRATSDDLATALEDADPLVRREAALAAPALGAAAAEPLLLRALEDPSPLVRYEGVRGWGRIARERDCAPVVAAARDADAHVALAAIDLLVGCRAHAGAPQLLDSLAQTVRSAPLASWHRAAHAIVSLATVDSALATERLLPFVAHQSSFVRTYAASAAAVLNETTTLRLLSRDRHPNVRVVALEALGRIQGRQADALAIEQLGEDDPQLIMTASAALEGTSDVAALPALLAALDRFTARRRETERDARMALLERVQELGSAADGQRIRALLRDYDPAVAARAAEILSAWTGSTEQPTPEPLPHAPVPTPAALDSLDGAVYAIEMQDGTSFELRMRAWDAPTNAHRFARLADAGYFDGLTYHRVVPNFVVQGGSPGANEYAGDGPYTRDELGLHGNWRGTVGLSTRGRDTGDGQMFLNLVDNVRLDHEYTVFADVASGMDVVDRILEGATIRRITRTDAP
jgi:cyclophilin family peptidyl-prolyl cis-trans isomerase/HEAT repeat protein